MAQSKKQLANLRDIKLSHDEAVTLGSKGGKASAEARAARKSLREELLMLLSEENRQERMSIALIEKAMTGDRGAFETIRDTIGEKPKDEVSVEMSSVRFTFDGLGGGDDISG